MACALKHLSPLARHPFIAICLSCIYRFLSITHLSTSAYHFVIASCQPHIYCPVSLPPPFRYLQWHLQSLHSIGSAMLCKSKESFIVKKIDLEYQLLSELIVFQSATKRIRSVIRNEDKNKKKYNKYQQIITLILNNHVKKCHLYA